MEQKKNFWNSQLARIVFIGLASVAMLIPLEMVRSQIRDRERHHDQSVGDITNSWGTSQVFTGPWISYKYQKALAQGKGFETVSETLYPDNLSYRVRSATKTLHRSIYDVPVYTAEITVEGNFVLEGKLPGTESADLLFGLSGLKGIQGNPEITFGGASLKVKSEENNLKAEIKLPTGAAEGDSVPFEMIMKINGSESLFFRPAGNLTTVEMNSDYPNPSFTGDFLPIEREVGEKGVTARWEVSQITL